MSRKQAAPTFDHDNPEWTKADFAKGRRFPPGTSLATAVEELKRGRGRPKADATKEKINLRVDKDVLARYRDSGPGWQTKMNDVLRKGAPNTKRKAG